MNAILEVRDLSKHFSLSSGGLFSGKKRIVWAVNDVSFTLKENETIGLVGESGCGKSTTGNLILRLLEPSSGSIVYRGTELTTLSEDGLVPFRKGMQMIFQDPYASLDPMMTLAEIVAEPWEIHRTYGAKDRRQAADALLTQVGLEGDYGGRYPHELSGGQRQRVAIARSLALDPELLIADEPTSALDVSVKAQIINLLRDIRDRRGLSMIFISHDLGVVRYISDRVIVMYLGRIMEIGPTNSIFRAPLHPYTRALLDAIPVPDPRKRKARKPLVGEASLKDAGELSCPFLPRCPCRGKSCDAMSPPLLEMEADHFVACLYPSVKEVSSC